MADFLDFRLSPKMHIKIIVFMGFLPKNTGMCRSIALLYCAIFVSVMIVYNIQQQLTRLCSFQEDFVVLKSLLCNNGNQGQQAIMSV